MALEQIVGKQQSKSEKARAAICEATIDCLIEIGYAKTSLNLVAARAGFSKGALQHHFPSKEDLITATANRLLQRTIRSRTEKWRTIKTVADAILYSWNKLVNTPPYRALLEILTAARTDTALKKRISLTLKDWNNTLDEQAIETYYSVNGDEEVRQLMAMTRSFLGGLIIQERYGVRPSENLKQVEKWIALVEPRLKLKPAKKAK